MKKIIYLLLAGTLFLACKNKTESKSEPIQDLSWEEITTPQITFETDSEGEAIAKRIMDFYDEKKTRESASISYQLGDAQYQINRNCGWYEFKKTDKKGNRITQLNNAALRVWVNGEEQNLKNRQIFQLTQEMKESLFLTELSFGWNDPNVIKKSLPAQNLEGNQLEALKIAFVEDNYEAPFLIETVFYLKPGEGQPQFIAIRLGDDYNSLRLLKLIPAQEVKGVRFSDFEVYKPQTEADIEGIEDVAKAYDDGELEKETDFKYENIEIVPGNRNCD